MLLRSLQDLQERRKSEPEIDAEGHYGRHVAATLRKLNPRQQAIAKLQIDQVLFNIEFPSDRYPPPPSSNYYSSEY